MVDAAATTTTGDDFDRLLAAYLDDALDVQEAARFHDRLRTDADARRLLLEASVQASALPRLGLEAAVPRPAAPPSRRWWLPIAAAAALMIGLIGGVAAWWSSPTVPVVRVAGGVIERAGVAQPAGATLRPGDQLVSSDRAMVLAWPGEGTRLELAANSRVHAEVLDGRKVLRLEQGGLEADVAQQPSDGGLAIITPHGRVEVVGTRFDVQVHAHSSRVAVTHGRVRVSPSSGGPAVLVEPGYAAEVTPTAVSSPGPAMVLPPAAVVPASAPASTAVAGSTVRITAADFTADAEGEVVGAMIRGIPVADGRVTRLTTPSRRPGGYARLSDHLRCTVRLTVDRPTTLALLLVCDQPEGGAMWAGNLQAERAIAAGTHEIDLTRTDLRLAVGTLPPTGSRIIAASVMCWGVAADLRMESLTIAE